MYRQVLTPSKKNSHVSIAIPREQKTVPLKQKLSERFAGCLSDERTNELQKELIQMRKEWE
ncbi:hypothetical protein AGMMS49982_16790 [Bacteroidia bacterium]|nr:hypothetical protein AGMMS49982_16790 [Bacteroidia bacterium]